MNGPDDVRVFGRTASSTVKAKFLVFFVKDQAVPAAWTEGSGETRREVLGARLIAGVSVPDSPLITEATDWGMLSQRHNA
jgi:hypothetical protein